VEWRQRSSAGHEAGDCLVGFDISKFEGAVSKIPALWDIADATPAPEDADLVSVLDRLGNPDA
jgi:hypothetical protein